MQGVLADLGTGISREMGQKTKPGELGNGNRFSKFGNSVGIFACKVRSRLSDKNLNDLLFLKKHFSGM